MAVEQIIHRTISSLTPWSGNARTHSKKQIRQIAKSIETFGFTNPILIDESGAILAGHGRVEAAKLLSWTSVPCLQLEHMSAAQKRAYVLADNKLALNAGWDDELLAAELGALADLDLDFDLDVTGFSIAETDQILDFTSPEADSDPADDLLVVDCPRRVQPGDIWQLGPHTLICGDSLDAETVSALMQGQKARIVFTDPPYNVPIEGHVGNSGQTQHREFAMASGEMSKAQFIAFLRRAFEQMADHSVDGSIHFVYTDWRHMTEIMEAGLSVYSELKNLIVWAKDNGGMGTFYRSRHELIFAFKLGSAPHTNTFELGQHGRYRTNVWQYRGMNSMAAGRTDELRLHPTVKPVEMIADAIRDVSARSEIILDLFGGSGSTLIAANKTGRVARLCELDPIYCDRILSRYEAYASDEAVQVDCGVPASDASSAGDLEAAE